MKLEIADEIKKKDEEAIFKGLLEYNLARIDDKSPRDLGVYLRDENGEVIAVGLGARGVSYCKAST